MKVVEIRWLAAAVLVLPCPSLRALPRPSYTAGVECSKFYVPIPLSDDDALFFRFLKTKSCLWRDTNIQHACTCTVPSPPLSFRRCDDPLLDNRDGFAPPSLLSRPRVITPPDPPSPAPPLPTDSSESESSDSCRVFIGAREGEGDRCPRRCPRRRRSAAAAVRLEGEAAGEEAGEEEGVLALEPRSWSAESARGLCLCRAGGDARAAAGNEGGRSVARGGLLGMKGSRCRAAYSWYCRSVPCSVIHGID